MTATLSATTGAAGAQRLSHPVRVPLAAAPLGIWGSFAAGRRNILALIPEAATRLPIVSGASPRRWHMVTDPAALRRVLRDRVEDYPKSDATKLILAPAIGDSLFVAEGESWLWQRRTAAPVFGARNIAALGPVMTAAAEAAAARLAAAAGRRAVDLFAEMVTATFAVIADVTVSGGGFDRDATHAAIDRYIAEAARLSLFDLLGLPAWVPRPERAFAARSIAAMKAGADAAIAARQAQGPRPVPDLLDLLAAGADPKSGRRMTDGELRDNLLTFIVAGHETTALTLAWAFYLLAHDAAAQDRARAEAQAVLGERAAAAADVPHLPYLRAVIDEALRLYPPAGFLSRTARERDVLCGTDIHPGDTVMLPVYALHRHHALWRDPDAFDPARFLGPAPARFSYLPFGDGPRICIGAAFAVQEAVIILATLIARFRLAPVPGRDPAPVMILTLRPEGGVWLTVEPA
ncbi:MAG: cytochrome P450 [Gemmobacter sp.]